MQAFTVRVGKKGPTVKAGIRIVPRSKKRTKWSVRLGSSEEVRKSTPIRHRSIDVPVSETLVRQAMQDRPDRRGNYYIEEATPELKLIGRGDGERTLKRWCLKPPTSAAEQEQGMANAVLVHLNTHCGVRGRTSMGVWRCSSNDPAHVEEVGTAWCAYVARRHAAGSKQEHMASKKEARAELEKAAGPMSVEKFLASRRMRTSTSAPQKSRRSKRAVSLGRSWHDGLLILRPGAELIVQFEGYPQQYYRLAYHSDMGLKLEAMVDEQVEEALLCGRAAA